MKWWSTIILEHVKWKPLKHIGLLTIGFECIGLGSRFGLKLGCDNRYDANITKDRNKPYIWQF